MKKFCLTTIILGTIYITIVTGCATKTVGTKNVDQEMMLSKKEVAVDKKIIEEETIKPTGQKGLPDKKYHLFLWEKKCLKRNLLI